MPESAERLSANPLPEDSDQITDFTPEDLRVLRQCLYTPSLRPLLQKFDPRNPLPLAQQVQDLNQLNPTGIRILTGLARGELQTTVAQDLKISPRTYANYKNNLFDRLGVETDIEAVLSALDDQKLPLHELAIPEFDFHSHFSNLLSRHHQVIDVCQIYRTTRKDVVAEKLDIEPTTARNYFFRIYDRTGLGTMTAVVVQHMIFESYYPLKAFMERFRRIHSVTP